MVGRNFYRAARRRFDQLVDRALVRGSLLAVGLLLAGSLIIVFVGAVIVAIGNINLENDRHAVLDVAWEVLLRAMSPDQLATNHEWGARIVLLIVTIIGLLLVSTLISILNSVIERRMEFIHRGRGSISVSDHLVILNWNQFGIRVVREIAQAAEPGQAPQRVSVLCDEDPVHLMHEIRDSLVDDIDPTTSKMHAHYLRHPENWILVRRGKPTNTADLANLTSIAAAKSVIILQDENVEQVQALRVVLAIDSVLAQETTGEPNHQRLPVVTFTNRHLLANQLDDRLVEIAATNHHLRRHINYIPLSAEDVRHGVETQVSRHRGLSSVYQDLLNFGGQELYIVPAPVGTTFGELLLRSRQSTPICLVSDSGLDLWPEWDTILDGKRVVMLAENRSAAERNPQTGAASASFGVRKTPDIGSGTSERFLFIGWNEDASRLAQALEKILPDQSSLTVVRRPNDSVLVPSTFCSTPVRTLSLLQDDPISRPGFLNDIEHVIVFTDQSVDPGTSDTSVLIDLLACRHHSNQISDPRKRFTIVAELRKRSSRHIAGDRLADDLLINDALLASAAVQLAFAPELEQVFAALLSVDNPVELITRHISAWDANLVGSDWDSLLRATCLSTGEIAVGYRRVVADVPEVILNPPRTTRCQEDDEIVLLSRRPRREG